MQHTHTEKNNNNNNKQTKPTNEDQRAKATKKMLSIIRKIDLNKKTKEILSVFFEGLANPSPKMQSCARARA